MVYELLRRNGFSGQSSTENNKKIGIKLAAFI